MSNDPTVTEVSAFIPIGEDQLYDAPRLRWGMEALLDRYSTSLTGAPHALTDEEERTGYREFTSSDGTTGKYAVGWRYDQEQKEADARREAEMAACPYVACTCGWHEDV